MYDTDDWSIETLKLTIFEGRTDGILTFNILTMLQQIKLYIQVHYEEDCITSD